MSVGLPSGPSPSGPGRHPSPPTSRLSSSAFHHLSPPPPASSSSSAAAAPPASATRPSPGSPEAIFASFRNPSPVPLDPYLPPLAPPSQRRLSPPPSHTGPWSSSVSSSGVLVLDEEEDHHRGPIDAGQAHHQIDFERDFDFTSLRPLDRPRNSPPRSAAASGPGPAGTVVSPTDGFGATLLSIINQTDSFPDPRAAHAHAHLGAVSVSGFSNSALVNAPFPSSAGPLEEQHPPELQEALDVLVRSLSNSPAGPRSNTTSPVVVGVEDAASDDCASSHSSSQAIDLVPPSWPAGRRAEVEQFYATSAHRDGEGDPFRSGTSAGSFGSDGSAPSSLEGGFPSSDWSRTGSQHGSPFRAPVGVYSNASEGTRSVNSLFQGIEIKNESSAGVQGLVSSAGEGINFAALGGSSGAQISPSGSGNSSVASSYRSEGGFSASGKRLRDEAGASPPFGHPENHPPGFSSASTANGFDPPSAALEDTWGAPPPPPPPPLQVPSNFFILSHEQFGRLFDHDRDAVILSMANGDCKVGQTNVEYHNLPVSLQRIINAPDSSTSSRDVGGGPPLTSGAPAAAAGQRTIRPLPSGSQPMVSHRSNQSVSSASGRLLHPDDAKHQRSPRPVHRQPTRSRSRSESDITSPIEASRAFDLWRTAADDRSVRQLASASRHGSAESPASSSAHPRATGPGGALLAGSGLLDVPGPGPGEGRRRAVSAADTVNRPSQPGVVVQPTPAQPPPDQAFVPQWTIMQPGSHRPVLFGGLPPQIPLHPHMLPSPFGFSAPATTMAQPTVYPIATLGLPSHDGAAVMSPMSYNPAQHMFGGHAPVPVGPAGAITTAALSAAPPASAPYPYVPFSQFSVPAPNPSISFGDGPPGTAQPSSISPKSAMQPLTQPYLIRTAPTLDQQTFDQSPWNQAAHMGPVFPHDQGQSDFDGSRPRTGSNGSHSSRSDGSSRSSGNASPTYGYEGEGGGGSGSGGGAIRGSRPSLSKKSRTGHEKDTGAPMNEGGRSRRSHEATKVCKICGKDFTRNERLVYHMKTHDKVRDFPCTWPDCSKAFRQKSDRDRHLNTVHLKKARPSISKSNSAGGLGSDEMEVG